jgi:D-alanyl-lipoteichoic acid acyltransferase DltB (MBOAT superfamily)
MVAFGLWHKASLLFLLWGFYHGVLLVLHRQVQQLGRRLNWNPPAIWMPISWIATISLISVGWIFFRANSWSPASQMLSALASPASYASHFLSSSLYLLIAVLAGGYAAVVAVSGIFDRPGESPEAPQSRTVALLARWRWFWIPTRWRCFSFG